MPTPENPVIEEPVRITSCLLPDNFLKVRADHIPELKSIQIYLQDTAKIFITQDFIQHMEHKCPLEISMRFIVHPGRGIEPVKFQRSDNMR